MTDNYDIAIVGSGFAGSLMAMIAHRLGRSVVLIDKGSHPRVVIGESSTPLTNLLLERLATRYDLPALRPLTKWGTWQKEYPGIGCGLKRGFTFYHHDRSRPKTSFPDRAEQLLVAASTSDEIADTHWYRADFDHFCVRYAQNIGVNYLDDTNLKLANCADDGISLAGRRHGREISISARLLIDASGPRGFLHRELGIRELALPGFPQTQAVYSHFSDVALVERQSASLNGEQPPYPVDNAAVHHVFDGGWIWVLQFSNGLASAGIAATDRVVSELNFANGAEAWDRALSGIPILRTQFAAAKPERGFTHIPRLSFRSATITGSNWALLPSAAGFVDPLLSTGFPLTLLGIGRLAEILENSWNSSMLPSQLEGYAVKTEAELLATSRLIAALYANMDSFPMFSALSLLYFAAASYAETAMRLNKPHVAPSFLLHDHPAFGPATAALLERGRRTRTGQESESLERDIHRAIQPFDLAGLGDRLRRNWHPVDPEELIRSASKVEATEAEMVELLDRCGIRLPSSRGLYPEIVAT